MNKITKEYVESILAASTIKDLKWDGKTTVVSATLPNGFTILEHSSCVSPENYDHEIGKNIALKRIADKIWELEGYLLQEKLHLLQSPEVLYMNKSIRCLALELPEPVWDDVKKAWNDVNEKFYVRSETSSGTTILGSKIIGEFGTKLEK